MGGGGGKGGSAPKAPDYAALAKQQGADNMAIAQYLTNANRVNQYSPYGSSTWTQNLSQEAKAAQDKIRSYQQAMAAHPEWNQGLAQRTLQDYQQAYQNALNNGGGSWTQTTSLTPEMQKLLNTQIAGQYNALGAIQGQGGKFKPQDLQQTTGNVNPTLNNLGRVNLMSYNDYAKGTGAQNAADSLYKSLTMYNKEQNAVQNNELASKLAAQGLGMGSGAYQQAMNQLQDNQNQAYQQAALQAASYAPQLQNQLYNTYVQSQLGQQASNIDLGQNQFQQGLANAQLGNQLNQQQYQQQYQNWMSPYQALSALNGNQVQMPQFQGYSQATPFSAPDMLGANQASFNARMGGYNAEQNKKGGLLGAGASLGGSLLGAFL